MKMLNLQTKTHEKPLLFHQQKHIKIPFDMLLFIAFDNGAAKTLATNMASCRTFLSKPLAFFSI